jgi:DNA-binding CsgD family transcriptional regulator
MIAGSAIAWLEAEIQPRLIADEELAILWANEAARRLLADKCEVEERAGYLNALDPLCHERLVRLVRPGTDPLRTCCIPLSGSTGHLLVRSRPLGGHEAHLCGLTLVRTDQPSDFGYRDLEAAFGLTPAEHRVLLCLLDGKEADRLTQEMGVSIETIRSHIRNFYAKLEVNSREQLFAKTRPFRV